MNKSADHSLGPLPTIHPRHVPVNLARRELSAFLFDWEKRHDLTPSEYLNVILEALQSRTGMHVRHERRDKDDN